jgi:flagellar motor protein MotB
VLSANALGEFHPLVEDDSPEGRRRNRRIEFKLTER